MIFAKLGPFLVKCLLVNETARATAATMISNHAAKAVALAMITHPKKTIDLAVATVMNGARGLRQEIQRGPLNLDQVAEVVRRNSVPAPPPLDVPAEGVVPFPALNGQQVVANVDQLAQQLLDQIRSGDSWYIQATKTLLVLGGVYLILRWAKSPPNPSSPDVSSSALEELSAMKEKVDALTMAQKRDVGLGLVGFLSNNWPFILIGVLLGLLAYLYYEKQQAGRIAPKASDIIVEADGLDYKKEIQRLSSRLGNLENRSKTT